MAGLVPTIHGFRSKVKGLIRFFVQLQREGNGGTTLPISPQRLDRIVETLRTRPGHENVRALVRELCVVGLDLPDSEINFEVPVPEVRGRMDALFGTTIFEFKRNLSREQPDAEEGLARYLSDRQHADGPRFLGIATDGAEFLAYELREGKLRRLDNLAPDTNKPRELLRWLDTALTVRDDLPPDPQTIRAEFGRDSLVYRRCMEWLTKLWETAKALPEAQLKRELWERHLEFVYGTLVEPEELFLQHTYHTFVAKTMAVRVVAGGPVPAHELLDGTPFAQVGLHGAVETDFFDWVLLVGGGAELVERLAAQVSRFRLAEIEVDVLKAIYESLIDPRQRHYLGEYYTPDWLAEWMCAHAIEDPLHNSVLDPSCGSGTFLFHAVRRFLGSCEQAGIPLQDALERCSDQVAGLDVHPVAVLFSRVTYLLAIGSDRLQQRSGPLFIPVYLGDSLQRDVRPLLAEDEIEIVVPGEPPILFPGTVAGDPKLLELTLRAMRDRADQDASPHSFASWLNANTELPEKDRKVLAASYERLRALHRAGRDHIWTYIIRNLTRPLWLSLKAGQRSTLIGNPPWLRFSAMSPDMQSKFRRASKSRGLWTGGKLAPHQDLSAYFFARCVERYLPVGGQIAFVMPFATLSRAQYAGFRTGRFGDKRSLAAAVRFEEVWTFDSDVWPLFEVPSCVIFARRTATAASLPRRVRAYRGNLPRRDAVAEEAQRHLRCAEEPWPPTGLSSHTSEYATRFKQGATIVPRRLMVVEWQEPGRFGIDASAPLVEGRVGGQDKQPWKSLAPPKGQVEREFLRPLVLGESIAPFRMLDTSTAIIPWDAEGRCLFTSKSALNGAIRIWPNGCGRPSGYGRSTVQAALA